MMETRHSRPLLCPCCRGRLRRLKLPKNEQKLICVKCSWTSKKLRGDVKPLQQEIDKQRVDEKDNK